MIHFDQSVLCASIYIYLFFVLERQIGLALFSGRPFEMIPFY